MVWHLCQHQPRLLARLGELAGSAQRTRQIDAYRQRLGRIGRRGGECALQCNDALGYALLVQQRRAQQRRAFRLIRTLLSELAQQALGGGRLPCPQRRASALQFRVEAAAAGQGAACGLTPVHVQPVIFQPLAPLRSA